MFNILKQVSDYAKGSIQAAKYIGEGLSVTFDHMRRRPITVQYPYEKLIPSERYRGRIHFEFMTEEYELATYDRHELNYDNVALGRLPYKVTQDPMVTPLRELGYLPKGVIEPHDLPAGSQRAGKRPEEITD